MKLEIENAGVWLLNAGVLNTKLWHLTFMKWTPGGLAEWFDVKESRSELMQFKVFIIINALVYIHKVIKESLR